MKTYSHLTPCKLVVLVTPLGIAGNLKGISFRDPTEKRKSLDETLANQFVYGEESQPEAEPISSSPSQSTPQPTPTPPTNTLM